MENIIKIGIIGCRGAAFNEGSRWESASEREARLWIEAICNGTDPIILPEQAFCVT